MCDDGPSLAVTAGWRRNARIVMREMRVILAVAVVLLLITPWAGGQASAADRHAGYYYPKPQTREEYHARSKRLADAGRKERNSFVNGLTLQLISAPYPPQVAIFAKGEESDKIIIISLYDNGFNTLFRLRGLLAMLTAVSRQTPFFREHDENGHFTFFDLLYILGFKQLTITDGDKLAHQIMLN